MAPVTRRAALALISPFCAVQLCAFVGGKARWAGPALPVLMGTHDTAAAQLAAGYPRQWPGALRAAPRQLGSAAAAAATLAAVGLSVSRRRRSGRTARSADPLSSRRRWFGSSKDMLKKELMGELRNERQAGKRLREQMKTEDAEAKQKLEELTKELDLLKAKEAALIEELQVAEAEEAVSEERLEKQRKKLESAAGSKWKPLIDEQNRVLRKILDVVERLEARKTNLQANLDNAKAANDQLKADLTVAEEMSASLVAESYDDELAQIPAAPRRSTLGA
mmetsp:Transcript_21962/g.50189  ORF Transcript_21962/g.50189 Transcript_21962/m.50189 type:complete len:279 (-) Transcript_21962:150-986(-)